MTAILDPSFLFALTDLGDRSCSIFAIAIEIQYKISDMLN